MNVALAGAALFVAGLVWAAALAVLFGLPFGLGGLALATVGLVLMALPEDDGGVA